MAENPRRLYIVTYDVTCPKRWRKVFRLMHGYGRWLQLSVFRCELTLERRDKLERALRHRLDFQTDRLIIAELGRLPRAYARITTLGCGERPIDHGPWIA